MTATLVYDANGDLVSYEAKLRLAVATDLGIDKVYVDVKFTRSGASVLPAAR